MLSEGREGAGECAENKTEHIKGFNLNDSCLEDFTPLCNMRKLSNVTLYLQENIQLHEYLTERFRLENLAMV